MHILLLGATGRVGTSVIEYALAANLHVTAVARNRAKIQRTDPHLTVLEGDICKPEELITQLRQPIDAIMNVAGGDVFKPSTVVTDSARSALTIAQKLSITRYLGITGVAEMESYGLLGNITTAVIRRSPIRHAVTDHDGAIALVCSSGTDWVLAGCPYIRDGLRTQKYNVVPDCFPGGFKIISPQDVADFLVKEAREQRFHKQVIGIWN
ncbi:MAG TPA: NAD(P)H-binding protein [Ktedonobacteraceae bacterium]|nr:NAD(P)H-binding protein [Ktedonobacteraceae bacterium]